MPVLSLAEARSALAQWPFVPIRSTGDDLYAVLEAAGRDGTTDSAFVGLAARAASPPTGPAALVLPFDDDALHAPILYGGREIPWINQRLLDDILALKIERADYRTDIDPLMVDDLIANGTLAPFSATVIAPPPASMPADSRLTVYYLQRDDVFVLVPDYATEADR